MASGDAYLSSYSNCIIAYNHAHGLGGGVQINPGTSANTLMDSCFIYNNVSYAAAESGGGGMLILAGSAQVRNCLIYNNTNYGSYGGGGLLLTNSALVTNKLFGLINCTIVNNYSTNEGGGIAVSGISNYIVNCVIAGNSSFSGNYPNVYYRDNADANSNNIYYSCVVTAAVGVLALNQGNITNDPVFKDSGAGNWRLSPNSPCVNTGTNQDWMNSAIDLDRQMRKRYGTVDMGCYERINSGTIYGFR